MSVKKISQLDTKSFLGAAGAADNSYVLINYEDDTTSAPVTYKATITELGNAITEKLGLYKKNSNGVGASPIISSQGAYITNSHSTILEKDEMITEGYTVNNGKVGDFVLYNKALDTVYCGINASGSPANITDIATKTYVDTAIENALNGSNDDDDDDTPSPIIPSDAVFISLINNDYSLYNPNTNNHDSLNGIFAMGIEDETLNERLGFVVATSTGELYCYRPAGSSPAELVALSSPT